MTSDNPIVLEVLKFEKFLAESRSRRTEAQLRAEISRLKSAGMESAELRSLKRLFEKGKLVSHDDYQLFLDLKRRNRSLLRRAGSKISRALRGT